MSQAQTHPHVPRVQNHSDNGSGGWGVVVTRPAARHKTDHWFLHTAEGLNFLLSLSVEDWLWAAELSEVSGLFFFSKEKLMFPGDGYSPASVHLGLSECLDCLSVFLIAGVLLCFSLEVVN